MKILLALISFISCSFALQASVQRPFITTWKSNNPGSTGPNQIFLSIPNGITGYNYNIYWEEVGNPVNHGTLASQTAGATITFPSPGTYRVEITGSFPQIKFGPNFTTGVPNVRDFQKLLTIEQWGDIEWTSMAEAFFNCSNLTSNASDAPNLTDVTDMTRMFYGATSFNSNLNNWDVSHVTKMISMFNGASSFNGNIENWNVSNVEDFELMFYNAAAFKGSLANWNMGHATNMQAMFQNAVLFNGAIGQWNVSNVTDMASMFSGAKIFNQPIGGWDVGSVTGSTGLYLSTDSGHYGMQGMFAGAEAFNQDISSWDVSNVHNMNGMFAGAIAFNQNIGGWDVSGVANMGSMFSGAKTFNENIGNWDVSNVEVMTAMFKDAKAFNQDIEGWVIKRGMTWYNEVIRVGMTSMFSGASSFNQNIGGWDVSDVRDMSNMFDGATAFNGDISNWDTHSVTDMFSMFSDAKAFNQNIGNWNTANVTDMSIMFNRALSFNGNIGNWNVSNVTNMTGMFNGAKAFNQNISSWNTGKVTNMFNMFAGTFFNHPIGNWNVANVTSMGNMFNGAASFNQDLSTWNVSNVTDMRLMFYQATAFSKSLGLWQMGNVSNMENMLSYTSMTATNYDATLSGWASQTVKSGIALGATALAYCDATARNTLIITRNWNITGDIKWCDDDKPFITVWKSDANGSPVPDQIRIPTLVGTSYSIYWEKIDAPSVNGLLRVQAGPVTITVPSPGEYRLKMTGNFQGIGLSGGSDAQKLIAIEQWGRVSWATMEKAFYKCSNLTITATDVPDLSNVKSMSYAFEGASSFAGGIGQWDVSTVEDMSYMFSNAKSFNDDISGWNTSKVKNMRNMFERCEKFNQDISNWDVRSVTNMREMFEGATVFNQNLGKWKVGKVTDMDDMLTGTVLSIANYDATLIGWASQDLKSGVDLSADFLTYCEGKTARNKLITTFGWSITGDVMWCDTYKPFVTTWKSDNPGTSQSNQIIISATGIYRVYWEEVGNPSNHGSLKTQTAASTITFPSAGTYRIALTGEFKIRLGLSGDHQKLLTIEQWGDVAWTSMESAFAGCSNLTSKATDKPNLSAVSDMSNMFSNASSFDTNIGGWNIGNVTDLSFMLRSSGLSTANYDAILTGWAAQTVKPKVNLGVAGLRYCASTAARDKLITNSSWVIFGDYKWCSDSKPFITTWKTDNNGTSKNNQITIPAVGANIYNYHYDVYWEEVGNKPNNGTLKAQTGYLVLTFPSPGTYRVEISGRFSTVHFYEPDIDFGDGPDPEVPTYDPAKIISIEQWGDIVFEVMKEAFRGCGNLKHNAMDVPNVQLVKDMSSMFRGAAALNLNLGDWNISSVTTMLNMLDGTGLSKANYDATLIGWAAKNTANGVRLGAAGLKYCDGTTARTKLVQERSWVIRDDTKDCPPPPVEGPVTGVFEEDFYPLDVFPNPTENYFYLQFQSEIEGRTIKLTDLHGRVLSATDAKSKNKSVEVESLPAGVYVLHVIEGGTLVKAVRLMKR